MSRSEASNIAWLVYNELYSPETSSAIAEGYNIRERIIVQLIMK